MSVDQEFFLLNPVGTPLEAYVLYALIDLAFVVRFIGVNIIAFLTFLNADLSPEPKCLAGLLVGYTLALGVAVPGAAAEWHYD